MVFFAETSVLSGIVGARRYIFLELPQRQLHLMFFLLFLQDLYSPLLRQTTLIILAMPDLDRQLGAQESLPTKTAVESYPPVPVNQQKTSVICSSILGDIPNQLLQRILQSIFRPIFSITVNSSPPLTSQKI